MVDRIGNCRILGEIGSGGMAVIYKAVQEPLSRMVAVKALKHSIAIDSHFALRFEREARFMASLQHENILNVHDFHKGPDGMYIIMEYVRGIDLYDLLELTPYMPAEVAAIVGLQVARALDYAHFRGLIHRDIKPANIMISYEGQVKLMDFGIARDESMGGDLTEVGTGVGTPSYMSPEQILGDKVDFRSDMFSLGIVLYQTLTGCKPFVEDETRSVMQKIRMDRYVSPHKLVPSVPSSIERILARCMEKAPANRYPTTQALIDDLMEFLAPRVPMNYNARLVMYLRDVGVLQAEEAEKTLDAGSTRSVGRYGSDLSLIPSALLVYGIMFLAVLVSGGVIQASTGRFSGEQNDYSTRPAVPQLLSEAGFLKVVAEPWAHVYIDGQLVTTTPSAARIPLAPGKHYINLRNPFFLEEKLEVVVRKGNTELVQVSLKPQHNPSAKVSEAVEP